MSKTVKALLIAIPTLIVVAALVYFFNGFNIFTDSTKAEAVQKTPLELEVEKLRQEMSASSTKVAKSVSEGFERTDERLDVLEENDRRIEEKIDSSLAINTRIEVGLKDHDRRMEAYHKVPSRASLPTKKVEIRSSSTTTRSNIAGTTLVSARVAQTNNSNSNFVTRQEFQSAIDSLHGRTSRIEIAFTTTTQAFTITLDSVMAKLGRLSPGQISSPSAQRIDTTRRNLPIGSIVEQTTEASNSSRRHAY
jgi:hypothetical protein